MKEAPRSWFIPDAPSEQRVAFAANTVALAMLVAHAALTWQFIERNSVTVDENICMPAGVLHWRTGTFAVWGQNPPLVKLAAGLAPLLRGASFDETVLPPGNGTGEVSRAFISGNRDRYFSLFRSARCAILVFSLAAGVLVFHWSKSLYGPWGGLLSLAVWCFNPFVIGFAGLVTTDMGVTCLILATFVVMRRYAASGSWFLAGTWGLVLGLAQLTKFTALLLYPLGFVLILLVGKRRRLALADYCLFVVPVSLLVINAGYLFNGTGTRLGDYQFSSKALAGEWIGDNRFRKTWLADVPIPLPAEYVRGLDYQNSDFEHGAFTSYLDGELRKRGWYHYYVYGLALKWPMGGLILVVAGLLLVVVRRISGSWREELLLYLPALAILLLVSMRIGFNSHLRYVLPVVPFLCIGAGKLARLPQLTGKWSACVVALLLAWSVFSGLQHHPHHLSYFNELGGGPQNGWRHFIDSNHDWGQDLFELKRWVDEHPEATPLHLAYFTSIDAALVGIEYKLPPVSPPNASTEPVRGVSADGPQPGWHAVSVNFVCGLPFVAPDGNGSVVPIRREMYAYFQRFQPVAKAGYSIFIYHISRDEADRVRRELNLPPLSGASP